MENIICGYFIFLIITAFTLIVIALGKLVFKILTEI